MRIVSMSAASTIPWRAFTSPLEKWAVQPSFVIGEWMFILAALFALWHAWSQPSEPGDNQRRRHLVAWVAALVAGTANDTLFILLPLVNNFWQAQGTIMLNSRMPLYIPCVYICFMYFPTVAVWRLGLPRLGGALLSGLAGSLFYAPYDIDGAKFLWWTWHDTDQPIAHRILGAPIGSTIWVITFVAAFSWLLTSVLDRDRAVRGATAAKALLAAAGLSSLLMVLQITVLQQFDGGVPGIRGLVVVIAIYLAGIAWSLRRKHEAPARTIDRKLFFVVALYFVTLAAIMGVFDPVTHRSLSRHQTYGPCHVVAKDITGKTRDNYLCAEDFDEDFTFACIEKLPAPESDWYTVCSRSHRHFWRMFFGVLALALAGISLYARLLVIRPKSS